ncbi:MAG: hypothetical protein DHS20C07_27380 [Methyloligella sp.]|nr:MAG: hypothetical protein DHS20C07_27380 [Methyloligella sp.]
MNNLLTAIAAFMILVLTALFTVPLLINWDDYRTDFEVRLSEIMGSKVELDGGLNVRLLPAPYVRAENIRIGESGKNGKPVLDVKELTLWVAVPPLLKGVVEASTVTLDSPKLLLQFDQNGRPSFDVGQKGAQQKASKRKGRSKGAQEEVAVQEAALSGFQLSPNLISLRNVKIKNGSLQLQSVVRSSVKKRAKTSGSAKLRSFEMKNIDGVLSAITLKGPFYFNGKYLTQDTPHFIRLAVGELNKNSDGKQKVSQAVFPVQGKVTTPKSDRQIEFDGQVGAKGDVWFAKGDLKAGLGRIGRAAPPIIKAKVESRDVGSDKKALSKTELPGADVKGDQVFFTSKLHVLSTQAKLTDILIRTGSLARPQTVRGELEINWRDELALMGTANGQVIDLNSALAGSTSDDPTSQLSSSLYVAPGAALSKLNDLLLSQAKFFERIDFTAKVAQIYLGQGDVRDFSLKVKGRDGQIRVEDLTGRMAGSSRMSVSGNFTEKENGAFFNGFLYLRGLQFQEFMRWAVPSYTHSYTGGENKFGRGKYMLSGNIVSEGDSFFLNSLQGTLGRSSLRGDLSYKKGKVSKDTSARAAEMKLSLRSGPLRIEDVLGEQIGLKDFEDKFSQFFKSQTSQASKNDTGAFLQTTIELSAQKVIFSDSVQKDVRLVWRDHAAGSFVETLSGVSEGGLKLVYENGRADGTGDKAGEDKFFLEVLNETALKELVGISGLDKAYKISNVVGENFYPLRFGVRRETSSEYSHYRFDGQMGGSDTAFSVFIPLEGDEKKEGVMTIFGGMESSNGALLLSKFLPFSIESHGSKKKFGPAKVTFTARGTGSDGFRGHVKLVNNVMTASYDGQFSLKKNEPTSDGEVLISSNKSSEVLALFGLAHLNTKNEEEPFRARGKFSKVQNGFALNDLKIAIGDRQVIGTGLFEEKDGQPRYRFALATERLDLQTLLGALQKQAANGEKQQRVQVANLETGDNKTDGRENALKTVWSNSPFYIRKNDKTASSNEEEIYRLGDFSIRVSDLQLSERLSLSDAEVRWRVHPNHIEIVKIAGKSLGGVFNASGILRERSEGYGLNGTLSLEKARLEEVGAAEEASIGTGEFSFNLSLSGAGSSPRALVSSLIGEGFLKISDGDLRQVNPVLLGQLAERFLQSENGDAGQLKADLASVVENVKPLKFKSLDLGLQLLDGDVKLRQKDFGIRPGIIGLQAELKLVDLSWMGNWSIQPEERKTIGKVPGIVRKIRGDLQSVAGFHSQMDVNEFERFLTLKHKERELRSLEKVRLEQEARRLAEERRQAEEELKRINEEKARLKREQEKFDNLNRTDLPPLQE